MQICCAGTSLRFRPLQRKYQKGEAVAFQSEFTCPDPKRFLGNWGLKVTDGRKRVIPSIAKAGLSYDFEYPFEGGLGGLLPTLPPDPVQFPRKPLDLKFAVLLMRSSYEATDDLDFIPMDQFQAKVCDLRPFCSGSQLPCTM